MRIVRFALHNPYWVVVYTLITALIGGVCLTLLPKDILPTFKTSAVQVVTFYPGMPAEVMEKDITTRLERWTGQSNGIEHQESKSMIGVSIVKDFFRSDVDPNTAMSQVTSFAMSDLLPASSHHAASDWSRAASISTRDTRTRRRRRASPVRVPRASRPSATLDRRRLPPDPGSPSSLRPTPRRQPCRGRMGQETRRARVADSNWW